MTAFYWPYSASGVSAGGTARGMSIAPFGSGFAIGDQATPALYYFSGSSFVNPAAGGNPVFATGYPGISGLAPGASGDIYALTWTGTLWNQSSPGAAPTSGVLPSGQLYAGLASLSGTPWMTSATSGQMFSGAAPVSVGSPLGASSYFLVGSGSTLWTIAGGSGIAQFSTASGTWTTLASSAALVQPMCLAAASGAHLAVGGTVPVSLPYGAAVAAINPVNPLMMATVSSGGVAYIFSTATSGSSNWTLSTSLSGLTTTAKGLCWTPDGTELFVTGGSAGLYILNYSLGTLTLSQHITGTSDIPLVMANGTDAIITQYPTSSLIPYTKSAGTWLQGAAVAAANEAYGLVATGPSTVAYGYASGIGYASVTASVWSTGAVVPLATWFTSLVVDASGLIYAAGTNPGGFAVVSGTTVLSSGHYSGNGVAAVLNAGRFIVADGNTGSILLFGETAPNTWSQQGSLIVSGIASLASTFATVFAGATSTTSLYTVGAPYTLNPITSGNVGFWNGSTWATGALGISTTPSAMTYDASGNLYVAATNNTYFEMSQSGTITASGIISTYTNQISGTTLGVSAMLFSGGHLYGATSLSGVLVEIL